MVGPTVIIDTQNDASSYRTPSQTKKKRDECIIKNGEENCQSFIEAHKVCLRAEGFKI